MNPRSQHSRRTRPIAGISRGFTLVELMVALSGGLFLSVVVFALARDASRFYQRESRLASATLAAITGFERLKADIQRASYLCTPNIQDDKLVRQIPGNPGITNLAGIRINADTPLLTSLDSFSANISAGQTLKPDQILLAGSYDVTDEFPGSVSTSGLVVTLSGNSPSLARLGFVGTSVTPETKLKLIESVFGKDKILRFVELGSRFQSYGKIDSVEIINENPQITLSTALSGIDGFAPGSSVNVVNQIRYRIDTVNQASNAWKPLFDASRGAPGEGARTELVREELDAEGNIIADSLDIAAEYAVDLEFGVTGQATTGGLVTYVASDADAAFNQFFDQDSGRPQGVRSVRARLSVRSREADRESKITGPTTNSLPQRIYRFKVGSDDGWARVRTFQADVPLPNQAAVVW